MDLLLGRRDVAPAPVRMIGFPSDGGLVSGGVTGTTALGLSAVWRCLDILSNGVSQLEWREMKGTLDWPMSRIVKRPMAEATRREWVNYVVCALALFDVEYLLRVGGDDAEGVPLTLWPLDPNTVMPSGGSFFSSALPFQTPDVYWVGTARVEPERVIVLRRSPMPGVSESLGGVLRLARIKFAEAMAADGYSSRYWQGGGSTQQYGVAPGPLTPDKAQQLSDRWGEKRRLGPDHLPILDSGLELKDTGADPTQASAVEARRELVADIGRYFGIPTHTLNAPAGDTETYSSTESGNQDLVRYTFRNYIGAIEDAISDELPGGRVMRMDTWPLIAGTQLAQAQAYQLATGGKAWLDVQEVRDRDRLPPIEDPDTLNPPAPVPVIAGGSNDQGQRQDRG